MSGQGLREEGVIVSLLSEKEIVCLMTRQTEVSC